MYNAYINYEKNVTDIPEGITVKQMKKIADCIYIDHPEIDWTRYYEIYTDNNKKYVTSVKITYCLTQKEVESRQSKIDKAANEILSGINDSMSDYEKTLYLYEQIVKRSDYSGLELAKQEKKPLKNNENDELRSIYGALVNKKMVCAGYAMAMQYLLEKCGIECTNVLSEDHQWNLVNIDGKYYYLDATWGDETNTDPKENGSKAVNYDYFCITTAELNKLDDHKIINTIEYPECTATEANYYHKNNLWIKTYDYKTIKNIVKKNISAKKYVISFKCSSKKVFDNCLAKLNDQNEMYKIIDEVNSELGTNIKGSYTYTYREELNTINFYFEK